MPLYLGEKIGLVNDTLVKWTVVVKKPAVRPADNINIHNHNNRLNRWNDDIEDDIHYCDGWNYVAIQDFSKKRNSQSTKSQ